MLNIADHKNFYLTLSAVLVGAAILCIIVFRFHEGIDFTGGTLWQMRISNDTPSVSDFETTIKSNLGIAEPKISFDSPNSSFLVRLPEISEADHQKFTSILKQKYPSFEELSFSSIGPSVSANLRKNAIIAMIMVLVGLSLYIAYPFRKVARPVSSWK